MSIRPSRAVFAAAMIGLGVIGLIYGISAEIWQPIPKGLPGRSVIIYLCAVIEIGTGVGLLLRLSVTFAIRVLLAFLLLWLSLFKLRFVVLNPLVEVNWESFGETAVMSAGAWCLFAAHAGAFEQRYLKFAVGENGIRAARLLFIAALPMFGLSHFAYAAYTATLVPKWLPLPLEWVYLTGAGSLAAALGMLFGVWPRLAANLETAMLWVFTLLVWVPKVALSSPNQGNLTEILTSCGIAAGAWLVADTYRNVPWLASGKTARTVSFD